MNDLNHKISKIQLLTSILLVIAFAMVAAMVSQCGGPDKKTIVDVRTEKPEPVPDILCDGENVSTTRQKQCPEGQKGAIVEVCKADGAWYEASNSCVAECTDEAVVAWESVVKNIMIDNCLRCHGGFSDYNTIKNLALQETKGGADGIDSDLYWWISNEAGASRMPQGADPLSQDDIDSIAQWIKSGMPESGQCADDNLQGNISIDYIETEILELLSSLDTDVDRENYRFLILAHKANLNQELENEYKAINRAINGISFENGIHKCSPIDKKKAICAFDIREIGKTKFDFLLIEKFDEIGLISNTTKGQLIRAITQTNQPWFHYDVFIDTVYSNADLYYKLMRIENQNQFLSLFGIDFERFIQNETYRLISTDVSEISAEADATRLVIIMEGKINGFDTACHITLDNPVLEGDEFDSFKSPFPEGANSDKIFAFNASESICGLPNRLHAFILTNNQGVLQAAAPEDIVTCKRDNCLDVTIDQAIDCQNCHVNGYIPFKDKGRDNIIASGLLEEDAEKDLFKRVYQTEAANNALFNKHNGWYREAMAKIGRTEGEANYLIEGQNKYLRPLSLAEVAAFFFVREEKLLDCIRSDSDLEILFSPLSTGSTINHGVLVEGIPILVENCDLLENPVVPLDLNQ